MSWVQHLLLFAVVSTGQDVVIYGPSFTQSLFDNLQDAFFLGHRREVKFEPSTPDQIALRLEGGQPVILTSLNLTLPESTLSLPLFGFPFVIAYNLDNEPQLFLSQDALLAIFQGRITRWNHANLTLLNPSISLPDEAIILVVGPLLDYFIQGLSEFADAPVDSSFLLTSNNTVILEKDVASYIKITPYSMGFSWMADAIDTSAALAFLENIEHRYASPYTGVPSALSEFHAAQQEEDYFVVPHNLDGRRTWPLVGLLYLVLPAHVDSCSELDTIQAFVSMISDLAATDRFVRVLGWEPATDLTLLDSSLGSISNSLDYDELLQGITCESVEIVDLFQIGASIQLLSPVLKLLVAYSVINPYFLLDPSRNNITDLLDSQLGGEIANGKDIDLTLTWAPLLTDYPNLVGVPVFMGSMVPIVNLGQNMSIVLSVPVLVSIYSGTIRYWNDLQIQSLNLGVLLPAQQIIVFAAPLTQPDRPSALFSVLLKSSPTLPFNWSNVNITLPGSADMERLVRATPFSIGYGFGHSLEDTSLVPKMMNPSNRAIAFSPSALAACWPNQDHPNCWPLALPLVAVLRHPAGYSTCEEQKIGVDFIGWIWHQNTPLEQFLVPISQADGQSMGEIEYCQGRSLRYTFPEPQLILGAEVSVVKALCGIGMIWSISQALALGVARNNSHLKSASVFFSLLAMKLLLIVMVFLAIDFILLLIYNIISPPEPATFSRLIPSEEDLVTGHRELTWTMCTFHDSPALYLLLAVKCIMALTAAAMSFSLRQLDRRFSAISALGGSFYNMFGSVVVAIVILVFFQSSDPTQFLYVPVFCGLWITFITLLALVVDSNVLLVCGDLSKPLRRLWTSSKDSKDKKSPSAPNDNSQSSSSKIFVVNREMFPSKYEHFDQALLEKVLEELNFQRQAVRRVLASFTTTGSPIQLTELERHPSTQDLPKSRSGLAQTGDLSPKGSSTESKFGDLPISSGNMPYKVVVDAPVSRSAVIVEEGKSGDLPISSGGNVSVASNSPVFCPAVADDAVTN